jgi:hypothetical protein
MTITSEDDCILETTTNDKYQSIDIFKERPDATGAVGYMLSLAHLDGSPSSIVQPAAGSAVADSGGSRRRIAPNIAISVTVAAGTATATTSTNHGYLVGDLITTTDLAVNVTNVPIKTVPTSTTFTYDSTGTFGPDDGTAVFTSHHGLIYFDDQGSDTLYLTQFEGLSFSNPMDHWLIDRLVDVATISLSSTGLKDVNSVPLPRWTTGAGVEMFLEISTAVSGGPPVVNARYTNSAGTSGRQGSDLTFNTAPPIRSLIRLPYQGTDGGTRSVQQIEVVTAGTGGVATLVLGKVVSSLQTSNNTWAYNENLYKAEGGGALDGRPCMFLAHVAGGSGGMTWAHYQVSAMWG